MSKWARRRDACEKDIIKALRAAGAVVEQLDGKGIPDLLVGYQHASGVRYMVLMECKDPDVGARNSRASGAKVKNALGLRDTQWGWWLAWRGPPPILVTTPREALCAIGMHEFHPRSPQCVHCHFRSGQVHMHLFVNGVCECGERDD